MSAPGADLDGLADWLVLHRAPELGSRLFNDLLARFLEPGAVLAAGRSQLSAFGLKPVTLDWLGDPDRSLVAADLDWLGEPGHHLITLRDPRYPARLLQIADPPPFLFVHGDPQLLCAVQLAVVGSRHPTAGGVDNAFHFARHLADRGIAITSGLAQGIDAAGHRGALEADGITIAVTGTGLDRVYPAQHRDLAHRIAAQGALVSEYPLGSAPRPANFPRRNRIISGLSLGVLVVEATQRSGSLITARLAAEQGREVFAIPGSIHNPLARGCHALIRQGAKLVEAADDILEELGPLLPGVAGPDSAGPAAAVRDTPMDDDYRTLLEAMGYDPVSIDELVGRTGLTPGAVSSMLLVLELQGMVSLSGGLYSRVS